MPRAPIPEQAQQVPRQRPRQFGRGLQALEMSASSRLHGGLHVLAGVRAQPVDQFDQPAVVGRNRLRCTSQASSRSVFSMPGL
jgi:hypothetical protein